MKKTLVMSVLAMSMGVTAFAAGSLATVPDAGVTVTSKVVQPMVQAPADQKSLNSVVNWDKGADADIVVVGMGSKENANDLMARRAAIVDGYRNLAEVMGGVQIDDETLVSEAMAKSDVIKTNVSAVVKGARILEEGKMTDGNYYVKMSLPLFGAQSSVAAAVLPETMKNIPFEAPEKVTRKSTVLSKETFKEVKGLKYSGIVVDCRGLGLDCTFAPQILDTNGRGVYGIENIDQDFAVSKGMVEYSKEMDFATSGKSRAGSNPLVIKANAVKGGTNSTNLVNAVLTVEDADRVLLAIQNSKSILEGAAVVFVR